MKASHYAPKKNGTNQLRVASKVTTEGHLLNAATTNDASYAILKKKIHG